jgi:hypothetical protein
VENERYKVGPTFALGKRPPDSGSVVWHGGGKRLIRYLYCSKATLYEQSLWDKM